MTREIVRTESGPIAVGSKFGWLVSGPVGSHVTGELTHANHVVSYFSEPSSAESHDDHLITTLKKFWRVESFGIEEEDNQSPGETFLRNLEFKDRCYEVGLPWI